MSSAPTIAGDIKTEFYGRTKWQKRADQARYGGTLGFGAISKFTKKASKALEKPKVTKAVGVSGVGSRPFHP